VLVRVAFLGTPAVAVPALDALVAADDVDVAVVVTNPDRPQGRSGRAVAPPVKLAAERAGLPVWQPQRPVEVREQLAALAVDACAVVAYGSLLPIQVLQVGGRGFVNLHFSLLPRWRGAAPVQHALRAGDTTTGVTTFVLDEGMDTGPILDQVVVPIEPDESAGTLLDRLAVLGAPVLLGSLRRLVAGAQPVPQPSDGATLAPKITPEDVELDLAAGAHAVRDLARSADPAPGAHTVFRGSRLKVFSAVPVEPWSDPSTAAEDPQPDALAATTTAPGTIVAVDRAGVVVACGRGAVRLTSVQPAGKARMDGAAFVNGYRPQPGERLGRDA
jgi:methionyl-tRNA formyltransferase